MERCVEIPHREFELGAGILSSSNNGLSTQKETPKCSRPYGEHRQHPLVVAYQVRSKGGAVFSGPGGVCN